MSDIEQLKQDLAAARREREEMREELEVSQRAYYSFAEENEYRGYSVAYLYFKMTARGVQIDRLRELIRGLIEAGNTGDGWSVAVNTAYEYTGIRP